MSILWTYLIFYNKTVDKKRGFKRKIVACIFSNYYTDNNRVKYELGL